MSVEAAALDMLWRLCTKCGRWKPERDFHRSRTGQFSYCAGCRREYDRLYYRAGGKVRRRQRQEARREIAFSWLAEIKRGVPCADCERTFPVVVMHFDHLPGEDKIDSISALAQNRSRTLVIEELKKCELVCANCHAIRTAARRRGVAQPGRAPDLGSGGREFKSLRPDSQGTPT